MPGIIGETPDSFTIEHEGQTYQVPKSAISPDMVRQYSASQPAALPDYVGTPDQSIPPAPAPSDLSPLHQWAMGAAPNAPPEPAGPDTGEALRNWYMEGNPAPAPEPARPAQARRAPAEARPEEGEQPKAKPGALPPEQIQFASPPASGPMGAARQATMGSFGNGEGRAAERAQLEAMKQQAEVEKQKVVLAQHQAAAIGAFQDESLRQQADLNAKQAAMQARYQQSYDTGLKEFQRATDTLANSNTTINPDRYYANLNTGQKVLAGIGLALGAFAAPVNGGRNIGLDTITKAVDQDIEVQKAQIAADQNKAGQVARNKQTLLGMMREKFGDDVQAEAATRSALLNNVKAQVDAYQTKQQALPEVSKISLNGISAGLAQQSATEQARFAQQQHVNSTEEAKLALEQTKTNAYLAKVSGKAAAQPFSSDAALQRLERAGNDSLTSPAQYDDMRNAAALAAAKDFNGGKAPKAATVEMFLKMFPSRARSDKGIQASINKIRAVLREGRGAAVAGGGESVDGEDP